ncbi:HNH endonuclease signature motif containing protein [Staphylococcus xylosus]|uniref:HNH endonuclease signature motif containing protein n=1 Tax=Staphylococcus xylosus TaxID=1288 RepID=UPI0030C1E926
MILNEKPKFIIKNNSQKGSYKFSEILTKEVLKDVCYKITGKSEYILEYDEDGYNKGRLAKLVYKDHTNFISFSEHGKVKGRNYFFQSLTTALVMYQLFEENSKSIFFYILNHEGNIETTYHKFMYRLMATANVNFINASEKLKYEIFPFISVDDLVTNREKNRQGNKSNKSSYVTKNEDGVVEIYAKTYGANKKEAILIAMAASRISKNITLYELIEQNLKTLPKNDKEALKMISNVRVVTSDLQLEKQDFKDNNSLRSPKFIFNLLEKIGPKKCMLCTCDIPELIDGAHIWPVADIKKQSFSLEKKLDLAISKENGMWLCKNHHKLYDSEMIRFNQLGEVIITNDEFDDYIKRITTIYRIDEQILTIEFLKNNEKRNSN